VEDPGRGVPIRRRVSPALRFSASVKLRLFGVHIWLKQKQTRNDHWHPVESQRFLCAVTDNGSTPAGTRIRRNEHNRLSHKGERP
jgi:hypothetical protein